MMKRRKAWLAAAVCVAMVFTGCAGSSEESGASEDTTSEETTEVTLEGLGDTSVYATEDDADAEDDSETAAASSEDASELLLEWKTTQYFTDEAVAQEDIEKILEAGTNTTSSMNGQPWHFTAVTNAEILEEIGSAMSFGGGSAPAGDFSAEDLPEDFDGEAAGDFDPAAAEGTGDGASGEGSPEMEDSAELTEAAGSTESASAETERSAETTDTAEDAGNAEAESEEAAESEGSEDSEGTQASSEETRSKAALGDTPLAIIVSCAEGSELDAGLATQSMFIEARLLGYGAKIVSSPTMVLNGDDADYYKELLGIPEDYSVVSVLLIGYEDTSVDTSADGMTGASERLDSSEVVTYVE